MKLTVVVPVYNQDRLITRALDSIPDRPDVEIIVVDDASTDNTNKVVSDYISKSHRNITLIKNEVNSGVAYGLNTAIPLARGEYLVWLGSDDYFYTKNLEKVMSLANGEDLVYFNLMTNEPYEYKLTTVTKHIYCGSVKLMKKSFIGETRNPLIRYAEDRVFFNELQAKKPVELFTDIVAKHYNYPRKGSLSAELRGEK